MGNLQPKWPGNLLRCMAEVHISQPIGCQLTNVCCSSHVKEAVEGFRRNLCQLQRKKFMFMSFRQQLNNMAFFKRQWEA